MTTRKTFLLLLLTLAIAGSGFVAIEFNNTAEASWENSDAMGDVIDQFTYPVGERWRDMVFIGDAMYAVQLGETNIYEVDPTDGTILATLPITGATAYIGLAWDGEGFWIDDYSTNTIYKINRYDGTVIDSFAAPGTLPYGLTWDGTYLWNIDTTAKTIYKLNPETGAVVDSFTVPTTEGHVRGLAFDGRLLWYSSEDDGKAYGLDPDTGDTIEEFDLSLATFYVGMGWDELYLWIAGQEGKASTTAFQVDTECDQCFESTECDDSNVCTDDICAGEGTTIDLVNLAASDLSGTTRTRGNLYGCTIDATLTGVSMYLDLVADSDVTLGIYEADAAGGDYDLLYQQTETLTNAGEDWYTIDGFSVLLLSGKFYAVVFAWQSATVTYYTADLGTYGLPVSFGYIEGNTWPDLYLPDPLSTVIQPSTWIYLQELQTEATGCCENTNNTASCDDGLFCTDPDTCADGVCESGPARDCDDGLFCTGTETCNETTDTCDSSGDPCEEDEECNEDTDSCDPVADDDVTDDDVTDDDVTDDDVTDDDVTDDDSGDDDDDDNDDNDDNDVADDDDNDDDDDGCCGC